MRVALVSAEFAPFAKAGGMGEVVTGLARELTRTHHDVTVLLPRYSFLKLPQRRVEPGVYEVPGVGCRLHLLDIPGHWDKIYGYPDDATRFLLFARAAHQYLQRHPQEIVHLHDWHAAGVALFTPRFPTLLTLHNLEYQGRCAPWDLEKVGLKPIPAMRDPVYPEAYNILKGAIALVDVVNTVSPSHAQEILTPEAGWQLHDVLRAKRPVGILNGLDIHLWDPATDPHIAAPYSTASSLAQIGAAKQLNRTVLAERLGLDPNRRPWICAVTRLVPAKGPEYLLATAKKASESGGTFLLLGTPLHPQLQKELHGKIGLFVQFDYDEPLAHQLYAASDLVVVPSVYEPCGLNQLIGLRYGTVPLVRPTGGLRDTIFDCADPRIPIDRRNGFVSPHSFPSTLDRVFETFKRDPHTFQTLIRRGMQEDHSWRDPAREYLKLYRSIRR